MQEIIARPRLKSVSRLLEGSLSRPPLGGPWKRAFDVVFACVALLVLMPLMLATAGIVRLLTVKSIILSERLIGREGKMFVGYRFSIFAAANAEGTGPWARQVAEALRT